MRALGVIIVPNLTLHYQNCLVLNVEPGFDTVVFSKFFYCSSVWLTICISFIAKFHFKCNLSLDKATNSLCDHNEKMSDPDLLDRESGQGFACRHVSRRRFISLTAKAEHDLISSSWFLSERPTIPRAPRCTQERTTPGDEVGSQGAQTISLCLTVWNNYSKCMGFTVRFMLSRRIAKYMYEPMLNKR